MAFLVYNDGDKKGTDLELKDGVNLVGRRPENNVCIADPSVSGQHATITISKEGVVLEDKGSTNGTRVNKKKIAGPVELYSGDIIKFGKVEMMIDGDDVPERDAGSAGIERPKIDFKPRKAGEGGSVERPSSFGRRRNSRLIWGVFISVGFLLICLALFWFLYQDLFAKK